MIDLPGMEAAGGIIRLTNGARVRIGNGIRVRVRVRVGLEKRIFGGGGCEFPHINLVFTPGRFISTRQKGRCHYLAGSDLRTHCYPPAGDPDPRRRENMVVGDRFACDCREKGQNSKNT